MIVSLSRERGVFGQVRALFMPTATVKANCSECGSLDCPGGSMYIISEPFQVLEDCCFSRRTLICHSAERRCPAVVQKVGNRRIHAIALLPHQNDS